MTRTTRISAIILITVIVGVVIALMWQTTRGPSFRPDDYDTLADCVANIPEAWMRGSTERSSAEASCGYADQRRRKRQQQ